MRGLAALRPLWAVLTVLGSLSVLTLFLPGVSSANTVSEYGIHCCVGLGGIAVGADGALWFVETETNAIGRITTAGSITMFSVPIANAFNGYAGDVLGPMVGFGSPSRRSTRSARSPPGGLSPSIRCRSTSSARDTTAASDG
jgi:hypothetical protein